MSTTTSVNVGSDSVWVWVAPEPVDTATAPSATFYGGEATLLGPVDLEPVVAAVGVESCSVDRRTLTLASADALDEETAQRVAGDSSYSHAFLITPDAGSFPVKILDIDLVGGDASGVLVTLADPLPRRVDPAGGSLQWAAWTTALSADDVTAAARRDIVVEVAYTSLGAAGVAGSEKTARHRLTVARAAFDTGLTTAILGGVHPSAVAAPNRRDQDLRGTIGAALDELRFMVLPHARAKGITNIDLLDGSPLQVLHADLTAARLYDRDQPEYADRLRARVAKGLQAALEVCWVDLNGDSRIGEGESDQQLTGTVSLSASTLSSTFPNTICRPSGPAWTRHRW